MDRIYDKLYNALDTVVDFDSCNPIPPGLLDSSVDILVDFLTQVPAARRRFDEVMRYRYRTPNRYFLDVLSSLEDNYDVKELLTTIHRQDEDIAFLSHQLSRQDSYVSKFEKMAKKIDFLKRQNKRLIVRNNELVDVLYQTKNNR